VALVARRAEIQRLAGRFVHLMRMYQELGLDLDTVPDSEQSGVFEVLQRIRSGRLKVFRTLENFFREYRLYRRDEQERIVKENDLLMNCLRHLCVFAAIICDGNRLARPKGIGPRTRQARGMDGWAKHQLKSTGRAPSASVTPWPPTS